jgi:hypothetical protein
MFALIQKARNIFIALNFEQITTKISLATVVVIQPCLYFSQATVQPECNLSATLVQHNCSDMRISQLGKVQKIQDVVRERSGGYVELKYIIFKCIQQQEIIDLTYIFLFKHC